MSSMSYQVRYRMPANERTKAEQNRIFSRSLENSKSILKVPEINCERKKQTGKKETQLQEAGSKGKDNHFLRLMQNHQME